MVRIAKLGHSTKTILLRIKVSYICLLKELRHRGCAGVSDASDLGVPLEKVISELNRFERAVVPNMLSLPGKLEAIQYGLSDGKAKGSVSIMIAPTVDGASLTVTSTENCERWASKLRMGVASSEGESFIRHFLSGSSGGRVRLSSPSFKSSDDVAAYLVDTCCGFLPSGTANEDRRRSAVMSLLGT
jgi:hypothetical protein